MNGDFACKSKNIWKLYEEALGLKDDIQNLGGGGKDVVSFEHVYREDNALADGESTICSSFGFLVFWIHVWNFCAGLANDAMDQQRSWKDTKEPEKPKEINHVDDQTNSNIKTTAVTTLWSRKYEK